MGGRFAAHTTRQRGGGDQPAGEGRTQATQTKRGTAVQSANALVKHTYISWGVGDYAPHKKGNWHMLREEWRRGLEATCKLRFLRFGCLVRYATTRHHENDESCETHETEHTRRISS